MSDDERQDDGQATSPALALAVHLAELHGYEPGELAGCPWGFLAFLHHWRHFYDDVPCDHSGSSEEVAAMVDHDPLADVLGALHPIHAAVEAASARVDAARADDLAPDDEHGQAVQDARSGPESAV